MASWNYRTGIPKPKQQHLDQHIGTSVMYHYQFTTTNSGMSNADSLLDGDTIEKEEDNGKLIHAGFELALTHYWVTLTLKVRWVMKPFKHLDWVWVTAVVHISVCGGRTSHLI